ncbi:MAG: pyridoxal-phosphate dependent enzyme [Candidatus Heimdallarchaeota archaeon]|nr:pyridoxal-phosphate dependent enzyme [Candidatus Heimdallarchaeota archaeon]MCK4877744.1 pyridoxal-phosphate dependent enzyme [Candidatus Heimdallarchaeota archaeon]
MSKKIIHLFNRFENLIDTVPWVELIDHDTPIERLSNLERELELDSLWVKRDDKTSQVYGGNKPRKLEFILADAKRKGYDSVMTRGGVGSNFCVANAAMCNKLGLQPVAALVDQPINPIVKKNLLINLYYKNELYYIRKISRAKWLKRWMKLKRRNIYYMLTPGGSVPLGTLGFVNAGLELKNQIDKSKIPEPDYIFVACGSAGTVAGLALGLKLAEIKAKIVAVQVSSFIGYEGTVKLAYDTRDMMFKFDKSVPEVKIDNIIFETDYFGEGYAKPTEDGLAAMELIKKTQKMELESTYTGKTLAALIGFANKKHNSIKKQTILFWNTFSSRDFSEDLKKMNYRDLPKNLHWIFEK